MSAIFSGSPSNGPHCNMSVIDLHARALTNPTRVIDYPILYGPSSETGKVSKPESDLWKKVNQQRRQGADTNDARGTCILNRSKKIVCGV